MRKILINERGAILSMRERNEGCGKSWRAKKIMRKKFEGYGLKFIHSNWNSNSSNNIYYEFEVIFGLFLEIIF